MTVEQIFIHLRQCLVANAPSIARAEERVRVLLDEALRERDEAQSALEDLQGEVGRTLDRAWRTVDACGGAHKREDIESGYAKGYDDALTLACSEIEKLGGRPS